VLLGCGTKVEFRLPLLPPTEPFLRSNKILAFAEVKGSTFAALVALGFTVRTMVNGPRKRVLVHLVLASLSVNDLSGVGVHRLLD
jgi:hypothetical protein